MWHPVWRICELPPVHLKSSISAFVIHSWNKVLRSSYREIEFFLISFHCLLGSSALRWGDNRVESSNGNWSRRLSFEADVHSAWFFCWRDNIMDTNEDGHGRKHEPTGVDENVRQSSIYPCCRWPITAWSMYTLRCGDGRRHPVDWYRISWQKLVFARSSLWSEQTLNKRSPFSIQSARTENQPPICRSVFSR